MRIQVLFLLLLPVSAGAACFDFAAKVTKPLREPIPLVAGSDKSTSSKNDDGMTFGAVRATIDQPIEPLLDALLDHDTTRSARVDETTVEKIVKPGYFAFHRVQFLIKPFLFVKIRWTEEWGYAISAGTTTDPKEVVISYEKVDGTSHIEHLCGNIVLRKLTDHTTDIYLYEEAKATQRSAEDTVHGLIGTLETLRKRSKT